MKRIAFLAAGLLSPTAAVAADYDCVLDDAQSIYFDEAGAVKATPIRFRDGSGNKQWKFTLRWNGDEAEIVWRSSPMQLSGKSFLIPTSEDSYAGFFVGRGPCLFTETHCGTTAHFAKQEDGSLKMQLHPVALTSYKDGHREPFVIYLSGACTAKDNDQ